MKNGKNEHIHLFIKFGKKEYMERLISEGEVFMNTMKYFITAKEKSRRDELEGLIQKPLPDITAINGVQCIGKNARYNYKDLENKNIYCLSCVRDKHIENNLNEKNQYIIDLGKFEDLGEYCVVIKNIKLFVSKLETVIEDKGLKLQHNYVRYEDIKNYAGEIDAFVKDKEFMHQQEYRFLVTNNVDDKLIVYLGNLEDCAEILPVKDRKLIMDFEVSMQS